MENLVGKRENLKMIIFGIEDPLIQFERDKRQNWHDNKSPKENLLQYV